MPSDELVEPSESDVERVALVGRRREPLLLFNEWLLEEEKGPRESTVRDGLCCSGGRAVGCRRGEASGEGGSGTALGETSLMLITGRAHATGVELQESCSEYVEDESKELQALAMLEDRGEGVHWV